MSTQTYYIVQTTPCLFIHEVEHEDVMCYCEGYGAKDAAPLSLSQAWRLYREHKAKRSEDAPRRFPRILKVSVEMKTITTNRR